MDPPLSTQSPDNSDGKPSFRKPLNDTANRKYRRHTPPIGGSDSSSSGGSPKRRSRSPVYADNRWRKDNVRVLERDSNHNRSGRGGDSHKHSDRQSYGTSHDYGRNDDYSKHHRHSDEGDRNYHRSSRSGRESRGGGRSDYTRHDSNLDRSRENWRSGDKYPRDKSESIGHRSKDKDYRHNDVDGDRVASGGRQVDRSRDDSNTGERGKHRDKEARDERRDRRRSPGDYKNEQGSPHEEVKGRAKESIPGKDGSSTRLKENLWSSNKEIDVQKRKHDDRDHDRRKEKYTREEESEVKNESIGLSGYGERDQKNQRTLEKTANVFEERNSYVKKHKLGHSEGGLLTKPVTNAADENASSSSKQVKETVEKVTSDPVSSKVNQAETAQDLNAAKVAAMKAAELVNRNLVGGGYLSTDQKKKLLWGSKKNTSTEESGNRWDLQLFADRERQEKFNKLMGVKGDVIPEHKSDKDENLAEKQERLQMDLEKQYTAGLRRRDGRTVGLGL